MLWPCYISCGRVHCWLVESSGEKQTQCNSRHFSLLRSTFPFVQQVSVLSVFCPTEKNKGRNWNRFILSNRKKNWILYPGDRSFSCLPSSIKTLVYISIFTNRRIVFMGDTGLICRRSYLISILLNLRKDIKRNSSYYLSQFCLQSWVRVLIMLLNS